mgnify:CR=1 FL=1
MKILILGDVMGISGRKAIKERLSDIIKKNQIEFTVLNGENSADDGKGITKLIAEDFFSGRTLVSFLIFLVFVIFLGLLVL